MPTSNPAGRTGLQNPRHAPRPSASPSRPGPSPEPPFPAAMIGRDGRTQPVALPGADRAGGVRGRAVHGRQRCARAGREVELGHARAGELDALQADRGQEVGEEEAPHVHGQGGRHRVGDRRQDRSLDRDDAEAQQALRPAVALARAADQAERVKPVLAALAGALLLTLNAGPAQARTPACPGSVHAPSAIVIEVSTGTVACARAADRRRPVGSTTKLMTALLPRERATLSDVFTAANYRPAPIESQVGLVPGERMKVSDLLRGLLAESGND